MQPANNSHEDSRNWILAVLLAALTTAALTLHLPHAPLLVADSSWYLAIAAGQHAAVIKPFAYRVLGPWIAAFLAKEFSTSIDSGFRILAEASLFTLVLGVLCLVRAARRQAFLFAAVLLLWFWADLLTDYYLPDLLHAALLAMLLLLLARGRHVAAAALLVPMFLTRESTVLAAVVLVVLVWRQLRPRTALIYAAASAIGLAASKLAAGESPSNIHGLSDTAYLIGKVPWNFSKNVLGRPLWTNTLPECTPLVVHHLPPWLHLGAITSVGMCSFESSQILLTGTVWLSIFGVAPVVFLFLLRSVPRKGLTAAERTMMLFCMVYGGFSFVVGPALGASVSRLVSYGWPAFLVFVPCALSCCWNGSRLQALLLLLLQIAAVFLPWWMHPGVPAFLAAAIPSAMCACVLYLHPEWLIQQDDPVTIGHE